MPATRSARSLMAALLVVGGTAALALAAKLAAPVWTPNAPDFRRKGPADAKVVIAEFSDFECPACGAAAPHLKTLEELYKGTVAVVFKHRAWDFHPHALTAATAAECAGRSGKFWELHDALFANQPTWSVLESTAAARELILGYGKAAGLDPAALASCMADPAAAAAVAADVKEAEAIWVRSTPTFIINGKRFVGANQLRTLGLNRIENELKK
ncbi:hypothetical protein EPO15_02110 [bacterium]|nr:MAG: hypothetical protein EPO15_02110 [bacterium]